MPSRSIWRVRGHTGYHRRQQQDKTTEKVEHHFVKVLGKSIYSLQNQMQQGIKGSIVARMTVQKEASASKVREHIAVYQDPRYQGHPAVGASRECQKQWEEKS
ncbi:hypothetical protein PHYBLDRAFT_169894 [Phycomyces blakesleeanus NRRL 1555(-)]|uniref:Uncharacterized protein n=1 Tax=Phycomyces blakesleeanus (strain ATCC 8743b / DSM 1359 / FGSC 10004 / NBRC 33097 / NRRL 1555) TaxID=763407 RepID=A0A167M6X4_PHYB8|nr:hypothetical protein PHYBLDRAFT_169894 [Phycomyces blakesleeanus NRRL 1555(-)]OAD71984.1 hypothetical protein PHYBLDRAFT_169894 [Phycomyces blakesleeanus NRRL 1555(-)]|eukprot:XP_018290024.1 hypothetical protein PHYBLDRAFT_169894 [Phycomyces blakesleeanus NRRL 1555(-)]